MFTKLFNKLKGFYIIIELKNNLVIKGKLFSCDQFHNIKLIEIQILNSQDFPHLNKITTILIRGSQIKYIHLPPDEIDLKKLKEETINYIDKQNFSENSFKYKKK